MFWHITRAQLYIVHWGRGEGGGGQVLIGTFLYHKYEHGINDSNVSSYLHDTVCKNSKNENVLINKQLTVKANKTCIFTISFELCTFLQKLVQKVAKKEPRI